MTVADQQIDDVCELDSRLFFCIFRDGTQRVVVAEDHDIEGVALAISLLECAQIHGVLLKARAALLTAPAVVVVKSDGG